ncbi:MAG: TylF/MycF/NovP-related O-methyltransferase [Pseudonocardiaceae bacterium]
MLLGETRNQSVANHEFHAAQEKYWNDSSGSTAAKLQNFTKYVRREDLTKFLARNDVFARQLHVHGSVVDIGVGRGASLMTWLHLSSIYEPSNYTRKVIGFDTFTGIPRLSPLEESAPAASEQLHIGGFAVEEHMATDIDRAARMHDTTRYLGHMTKVELVIGDVEDTLAPYLDANPHLVVSLLHLDADTYGATRCALELLRPRMPRGTVVVFDELGSELFPGETAAWLEHRHQMTIRRFRYAPAISYAILD